MANSIVGIIDRLEGDFAVLKIAGDQELYWLRSSIDFNYAVGDSVNIILTRNESEPSRIQEDAKNILRQIFQPNASI